MEEETAANSTDDTEQPKGTGFTMEDRDAWDSIVPHFRMKLGKFPVHTAILRYTGTEPCSDDLTCMKAVQNIQRHYIHDKEASDIMYNFLIGGNGKVYEGTGWTNTTMKDDPYGDYDFYAYDIAYIGRSEVDVTPEMRAAARLWFEEALFQKKLSWDFRLIGEKEAIENVQS